MRKLVLGVAIGVVALVSGSLALAASVGETYGVNAAMTAKAEVPAPKGASGKGTFSGSYVESGKTAMLSWKLVFSGLTGPATAAHIHMGKTGVAGPVIVPLCGPCKSGMTGKVKITDKVIDALESGKAYANVHTAKNAGGEIRGQIKVTGG